MKKVVIIPDAGPENPFQYELIGLLTQHGYHIDKAASKYIFPVLRAVHQYRPDVLYFDWLQSLFLSRYLVLTLIRSLLFILEILYIQYIRKTPIIHTFHNLYNHAEIWVSIEQQINHFFLPRCRYIRVYAETTKKKILELYHLKPEQIVIIQDVPFHYHYPNTVSRYTAREYLQFPPDAFVYAFFGSIKPYKGVEDLIESFKAIATSNDYLLIAGAEDTPAYTHKLQALIQQHPRIQFVPAFVADETVQYYMNAADLMVLPFHHVEHSGSVDLCMSFKKPIITLNTPFLSSLLSHQKDLLFRTPQELAQIMRKAKIMDLSGIAQENFRKADTTNHEEMVTLFDAVCNKGISEKNKATIY